ncbi:MAG: helix-turn-helix domain-containing protein [Oscillospiraceae bacterium]
MEKEINRGRKKKEIDGEFAEILSKLLQEAKEKGISQDNIAQAIGVSRQSLGKWANGVTVPDILDLKKLANYFDVSADYLLGLNENATTDTDLKAVCDYTGLNEKSVHLLNLLNKIKKLNISEAQPPIIDILDNLILNINDYYYKALYLLQHAIGTTRPIDTKVISVFSNKSLNYKIIHGEEYKTYLLQKCNHLFEMLTEKIVDTMGYSDSIKEIFKENDKKFGIDMYKDVEDMGKTIETLIEICQKLIKDNEVKKDNGKHNPKEE